MQNRMLSYHEKNWTCENDLMVPSKSKDIDAFRGLYNTYAPALYGVILQLVPDVETANAILEKSFLKIWRELDGYDASKGRLFSLMVRITLQVCKNDAGISKNRLHQLLIKKELSTPLPEQNRAWEMFKITQ